MYTGPKLTNDDLVFGYDTGYGVADNNTATRFYEGEPATNLWDSMLNTQSMRPHTKHYWDGSKWFENSTYTHPGVNGPKGTYLGVVFKHVSGALGSSWGNNSYGYMLRDIACTNGATMIMSSWIYASNDCNIDSIPAVIEGESGGESTVAGYPASYDLSNKGTWQVTAKKAISDGNTRFIPLYPRKNGVTNGSFAGFFMWALPQVTYGNHVVTPLQPGSTRSSTESLIDLAKTIDLDVSNVSYDSTGQPTFDGTNDLINLGNIDAVRLGRNFTIECVVKPEQDKWMYFFHKGYGSNNSLAWGRHSSNDNWFFATMIGGSYQYSYMGTATLNKYCHLVATYDGANLRLYENGILKVTSAKTHDMMTSNSPLGIGGPDRYWNGKIPVTKLYRKVLSAEDVKQNFNAYKNRFNI